MLRLATASDFEAIHAIYMAPAVTAALDRAILDHDEFRPIYVDLLQRPNLYAYTLHGRVVGFCHLSRHIGGSGHLSPFVVSPEVQGQGHGRRMLSELIIVARSAGMARLQLFVARSNLKALALYRSHGLQIEGTLSASDEYTMALALDQ